MRECDFCGKPVKEPGYFRCALCLGRIQKFIAVACQDVKEKAIANERNACIRDVCWHCGMGATVQVSPLDGQPAHYSLAGWEPCGASLIHTRARTSKCDSCGYEMEPTNLGSSRKAVCLRCNPYAS